MDELPYIKVLSEALADITMCGAYSLRVGAIIHCPICASSFEGARLDGTDLSAALDALSSLGQHLAAQHNALFK